MFDFLLTPETAVAFVLAFVAGIMRGYTGFGTPIFLSPIYAFLFGPIETVPLLIIMEIGVVAQMLPSAWPKADWKEIAGLALGCLIMFPVGGKMLHVLDPAIVKKAIGIMVLFFVAMLWFGWRYRGPRNHPVRVMIGGISGFTNGLTGIGGPPPILYYVSGEKSIESIRANLIVYFSFITLVAVPTFLIYGLIDMKAVWRCVLFSFPHLTGIAIGGRLFHGTSEALYIKAALVMLLCSGLLGVFG